MLRCSNGAERRDGIRSDGTGGDDVLRLLRGVSPLHVEQCVVLLLVQDRSFRKVFRKGRTASRPCWHGGDLGRRERPVSPVWDCDFPVARVEAPELPPAAEAAAPGQATVGTHAPQSPPRACASPLSGVVLRPLPVAGGVCPENRAPRRARGLTSRMRTRPVPDY